MWVKVGISPEQSFLLFTILTNDIPRSNCIAGVQQRNTQADRETDKPTDYIVQYESTDGADTSVQETITVSIVSVVYDGSIIIATILFTWIDQHIIVKCDFGHERNYN